MPGAWQPMFSAEREQRTDEEDCPMAGTAHGSTAQGSGDPTTPAAPRWPVPLDEDARLHALQRFGAALRDGAQLGALTRLAAYVCGTESASVDLVAETTLWHLAVEGGEVRQSGRADGPTAYLVNWGEPVAVDDARADHDFPGRHVVGDLGLRRWVAVPLISKEGHVLGALTAYSRTAGTTSPVQLDRMRDLAGQVMAMFEMRRLAATVSRLATHDTLTGLVNRRGFCDALESALRRAERGLGSPSVVVVNLEGVSQLADSVGQGAVDVLLKTVAARLVTTARRADTVARLGTEEFAVLLEHTGGPGATGALTRLRDGLAGAVDVDGRPLEVFASLGVTTYRPGDTPAALLARADAAMFADKTAPTAIG
jgi:diguanylate cyclase (GGDEF)-like protein